MAVSVVAAITRGFTTANPWGWLDKSADAGQIVKPDDTNKPDDTKTPEDTNKPDETDKPEEPAVNWADVYTYESQFENGEQHLSITGFVMSPCMVRADIVIPAKIGDAFVGVRADAFNGCMGVETVVIEDGVEFIGDRAFYAMPDLKSVEIKGELGMLGTEIFACNSTLSTLKLGEGLKKISYGMFKNCTSVSKVIIPSTVNDIQAGSFSGWTAGQTLYFRPGVNETVFLGNEFDSAVVVRDYTGD